ncbi:MAG: hypothetical protein WAO19_06240 [Candidatus Kryptoniota bacterium]
MGTGETLLTIVAIVLLGSIILTTNGQINSSSQTMNTTNFGLEEVALATKIFQEAQAVGYDDNSVLGQDIASPASFTAVNKLGQETGSNDFDDFDDWNGVAGSATGLTTTYENLATGTYKAKTKVKYVKYNTVTKTLDTTSTQQWSKRLDIWVWNTADSAAGVVHMYTIMSYW